MCRNKLFFHEHTTIIIMKEHTTQRKQNLGFHQIIINSKENHYLVLNFFLRASTKSRYSSDFLKALDSSKTNISIYIYNGIPFYRT